MLSLLYNSGWVHNCTYIHVFVHILRCLDRLIEISCSTSGYSETSKNDISIRFFSAKASMPLLKRQLRWAFEDRPNIFDKNHPQCQSACCYCCVQKFCLINIDNIPNQSLTISNTLVKTLSKIKFYTKRDSMLSIG